MFYKKIWAVLRKEFLETKRNVLLLLIIILLPMVFGIILGTFKEKTPIDTPVLVVPEHENVSRNDLVFVSDFISGFTTPEIEYNKSRGKERLLREEAYFMITVPQGISGALKKKAEGTIWVYVDSSITPVSELSAYVVDSINSWIKSYNQDIDVELIRIGERQNPFIYFIPGVFILLISIVGLLIVPMATARDKWVIQRLMVSNQTSVTLILSSKLLYAVVLVMIQFAILNLTEYALGAPTQLNFWVIAIIILTTTTLTAVGLFTIIITKFKDAAKHINALFVGVVVIFSGIVYPVGFMPNILRQIAEFFPVYYSAVLMRCFMFKDISYTLVGDYILILAGFTVFSILLMLLSARRIRG